MTTIGFRVRVKENSRQILTKRWPKAKVVLFGSFANGLSVKSSNDIDVCLIMDWVEGAELSVKEAIVREATDMLRKDPESCHVSSLRYNRCRCCELLRSRGEYVIEGASQSSDMVTS